MGMLGALLAGFAAVALLLHLATVILSLPQVRRRAAPAATPLQPVTLLRPVCGLDRFDAETLASSFLQDHPDHEVIFCAARADDPAVALIRSLIAAHPQVRATLLIGEDRITGNPKLNNLAKGWTAAKARWIVMADSNLLLPPDYLTTLAGCWAEGTTGLVSCPAVGIRPEGLWGALECAFLNSNQARLQLAADSLGFGFAQGKTLFWRRDLLDQAGGLATLGRNLAEDVAATKTVREMGLRVTLPPLPFAQPIGRRTLAQVWGRQLRWSKVRRDGFAGLFLMEPLNGALLPALACGGALAALGQSPLLTAPFLLAWYGAEVLLARSHGWPMQPRDILAMGLRDLLIPALWMGTFLDRGFEWRGTAMAPAPQPTTAE